MKNVNAYEGTLIDGGGASKEAQLPTGGPSISQPASLCLPYPI